MFPVARQRLIIKEVLFLPLLRDRLVQRRHRDINMSLADQIRHEPVEQGQKKRTDMRAVDIGICHDDDLVVAQLCDVKIVPVAF